ncbi:response regulator [Gloeobacter kilaueensis]|uniref:Response regulator receiver protein n=1 Tax=Gloeobacter kilaueensis (strain ATCC BAA-2537 / CCAP 1431/1 / ULC 316 / JS1) TaxID=1183438 RepID=U5QSQ2_GLOK1|nr:response regulator [Gloeobacter kilaueensis]AGY60704.1 response regulator receiver protein [Gloeobacter kilaueensis JS1]
MTQKRILVAEDVADNLLLIQSILESNGYAVTVAQNGAEAIELATSQLPDLILMDLSLPVVDGWKATRVLKSQDSTRPIPIIALTAHAMQGDREKALLAGCDDYMSKPIDIAEIEQVTASWLARTDGDAPQAQ